MTIGTFRTGQTRSLSQEWGVSGTQKFMTDSPLVSPSPGEPGTAGLKFRCFRITLSPVSDITDDTKLQIVQWCRRQSFAYAVLEHGNSGKRHAHIAVLTPKETERATLQESWWKRIKNAYPGSVGRIAVVVNIMYNNDWYNEYLRKEDGREVIYDNYDSDIVSECFPTSEQQAQLVELVGKPTPRMHYTHDLCDSWESLYPSDSSYESAIRFLNHRMFIEKKGPYLVSPRKQQELAWFLYRMRNKILEPNAGDRKFANDQTMNFTSV